MKRYFANLVKVGDGFGLNILIFDFNEKTITQRTTDGNEQDAAYTDFSYGEDKKELTFVVYGTIERLRMCEFSEETYATLSRPDNWKNLCHGLSIKSEKTVAWLERRGITPLSPRSSYV